MSKFSFVFEDSGILHASLEDIDKKDGKKIVIHPVWFTGYEETMFSEEVTYSENFGKWSSSDPEHSWLEVLTDKSVEIFQHDIKYLVQWQGSFFHCEGDLLDYWATEKGGYELVEVSGVDEKDEKDEKDDTETSTDQ